MLDPFPIPPIEALSPISAWLATTLNMPVLPLHLHEVIIMALFYQFTFTVFSPIVSRMIIPKVYNSFSYRTRLSWDVHVVSLVQSILICALGLYILFYDEERAAMGWREKIWGYDGILGLNMSMAVAYFIWDFILSLVYVNIFGWGMLAHAVAALSVYALGYRPFVNYYAPVFILYELSSPFLNVHWFCDKLDMTGSDLQFINGIFLMTTFFSSRLVWGIWATFQVFQELWQAYNYQFTAEGEAWLQAVGAAASVWPRALEAAAPSGLEKLVDGALEQAEVLGRARPTVIPAWLMYTYLAANITLTSLNVFWFGEMIRTIRTRFDPPWGTKEPEEEPSKKAKPVEGIEGFEQDDKPTANGAQKTTGAKTRSGATRRRG